MQKWYWCGQSLNVVSVEDAGAAEQKTIDYGHASEFFEPTTSDRNIGIRIRDLTKVTLH